MSALKPSFCYLRSHNGLTPEYFSLRVEVANGRCCINGSFWVMTHLCFPPGKAPGKGTRLGLVSQLRLEQGS